MNAWRDWDVRHIWITRVTAFASQRGFGEREERVFIYLSIRAHVLNGPLDLFLLIQSDLWLAVHRWLLPQDVLISLNRPIHRVPEDELTDMRATREQSVWCGEITLVSKWHFTLAYTGLHYSYLTVDADERSNGVLMISQMSHGHDGNVRPGHVQLKYY